MKVRAAKRASGGAGDRQAGPRPTGGGCGSGVAIAQVQCRFKRMKTNPRRGKGCLIRNPRQERELTTIRGLRSVVGDCPGAVGPLTRH